MAQGELHTFVFADISGYSLVTALAGDEAAADMALHFMSRATTLAAEHYGEVVKGLGDAVMLHADSPVDSIRLALALMDEYGRDHLPAIHAGVHTGPALRRSGDWWGTTVNVAAHVANVAEAGQLLVTKAARAAAGNMSSISFRGLGSRRLKNIPFPVQVYAATRAAPGPPCDGLAARVPQTGRLAARFECKLEARSC